MIDSFFSRHTLQDTAERAVKTFLQTFFALLAAAGTGYLEVATVKGIVIAAGAAALSAISNSIGQAPQTPDQPVE